VSITIIISAFMAGLGFGSLISDFVIRFFKKLKILYFYLELLIGFFGILSLSIFIYLINSSFNLFYLYFINFILILIPTILMGMTLPIVIEILRKNNNSYVDNLSKLYTLNTYGSAIAALISSFILISFLGLDLTLYFSATINLILAILILLKL